MPDISVSNQKGIGCNFVIKQFQKHKINCRLIPTTSLVNNTLESGCLITVGKQFAQKDQIRRIWKILKGNYTCAYIKIENQFSGCIYDYISTTKCPHNTSNDET